MEILKPCHEIIQQGEIGQEEHHREIKDSKVKPLKKYTNNQIWTLSFDGPKSKKGSGASVELVSPTRETYLAAHWLQFPWIENVAKYE